MNSPESPTPHGRAFCESVDPSAYVARRATEAVFEALTAWADARAPGRAVATLIGPPGIGKTFLLRRLEAHLNAGHRRARALYLPYAGIEMPDLAIWVRGLLGRPIPSPDRVAEPDAALEVLLSLASSAEDPFYLIIDDADSVSQETLRAWVAGIPATQSTLRVLLALNDDARGSRVLAALDPVMPCETQFHERMSESETTAYIEARLAWAGIRDATSVGFDAESIARIYGLSRGVTREVQRLAAAHLEGLASPMPQDLASKHRREDWMGQPLDEDL